MIFRLFFFTTLFVFNLYACKGGYLSCVQKLKDAHAIENNYLSLPLEKGFSLLFTRKKPNGKILKFDPFLSLYLVKENHPFRYPFDFSNLSKKESAVVTKQTFQEGRFLQHQIGLDSFGRYSKQLSLPAVITDSYCSLEGLVTQKGVIEKEYLKHFLHSKESQYGDIGVRVEEQNKRVVVSAKDPFFKGNPFQKGDIIVAFDGKKVFKSALFMQKVLFAKVATTHTIKIQRAKKLLTYRVSVAKRFGGGFVSDTFLESKGLYFDENLLLTGVNSHLKEYGLHCGDRLIQINGVLVKRQKEVRESFQKLQKPLSLLFERNGFEFFVNIK